MKEIIENVKLVENAPLEEPARQYYFMEKAKEYGRRLCHLAVSSGIVSGLVLLAFSPLILKFANLNATS